MLRQFTGSADPVLSSANAFAANHQPLPKAWETSSLGQRQTLDYQQWVALLQAEAQAAAQAQLPRQTILLGDSLTLWFPASMLPGRRTWLNQAISGENSGGLLNRLYLLDQNTPDALFIMIGINDLIWGGSDTDLVYNLRRILQYLKATHPQARVVLQSILPHGGPAATWEGRDRLLAIPPEQIVAVNDQLRRIAAESGAEYLDLYPLFVNGEGYLRSDLTTDGLRLNQNGYLVWRSALALVNEAQAGLAGGQ
ncbi:MAG TPA: lysophospholipase [Leptolyngbyaceae cyanobacterium M65_K2018_010]|nr:lysophospholipase [Leptolyngbyaceae cyanobacterium M65_K2018_010]